jgi:hypothetical protein
MELLNKKWRNIMKKIYIISKSDISKKEFNKIKELVGDNIDVNLETLEQSGLKDETKFNEIISNINENYDYIIFKISDKDINYKIVEFCNNENNNLTYLQI